VTAAQTNCNNFRICTDCKHYSTQSSQTVWRKWQRLLSFANIFYNMFIINTFINMQYYFAV